MIVLIMYRRVFIVWSGAEGLFIRIDHLRIYRHAAGAREVALSSVVEEGVER
jgi:hypothetical protein